MSAAAALAACSTDAPDAVSDTESPASRSDSVYADGEYTARGFQQRFAAKRSTGSRTKHPADVTSGT